jgi:hypothetical protein
MANPMTTVSEEEKLLDEICATLLVELSSWDFGDQCHTHSVILYLVAIRHIEKKPFADADIQARVLAFLEAMLDAASHKMMSPAMDRIDEIAEKKMKEV